MSKPLSQQETVSPKALAVLVFVAGITTMAGEILLSRFIGPFFGSSLLIWTFIIFSVLFALTLGYVAGGNLADKHRSSEPLCAILQFAALLLGAGPFVMRLVLLETLDAKNVVEPALGVIFTMIVLILPMTLAGMAGPFIIRVLTTRVEQVGEHAGRVLALSTVGSILGTFLPTYFLIPLLGTLRSYLFLATMLCAVAVWVHRQHRDRKHRVWYPILGLLLLLWLVPATHMRPLESSILNVESIYNNIQVKEQHYKSASGPTWRRLLVLNEGFAIHSITNDPQSPTRVLVGSVWDYMSVMPLISPPPGDTLDMAIVGLAGGTVAKGIVYFFRPLYKNISIEGAEIDPKILEIARDQFLMTEPEITGHALDGRAFLATRDKQYDLLLTDAYRQPYIPFHLVTQEYYQLVKSRLKPTGFAMVNCGSRNFEDELLQRVLTTMKTVFKYVYVMEIPRISPLFTNYLLIASEREILPKTLLDSALTRRFVVEHAKIPTTHLLTNIRQNTEAFVTPHPKGPMTDDQAPVEHLVDLLIIKTILTPGFEIPGAQR